MQKKLLTLAVLASCSLSAVAGALNDLNSFLKNTQSATGQFEQKVITDKGENPDGAGQGTFKFLRPGCFSWHYEAPFEELMMSNGKTLWLYDVEMAQVTVKKLTSALPATPASILFGNNNFSKDFEVKELPSQKGLNWLLATPKDSNSAFSEVRIAFKQKLPVQMILKDNFGQRTELVFTGVKGNVPMKKTDFDFKVPKGVDVLEDRSAF